MLYICFIILIDICMKLLIDPTVCQ